MSRVATGQMLYRMKYLCLFNIVQTKYSLLLYSHNATKLLFFLDHFDILRVFCCFCLLLWALALCFGYFALFIDSNISAIGHLYSAVQPDGVDHKRSSKRLCKIGPSSEIVQSNTLLELINMIFTRIRPYHDNQDLLDFHHSSFSVTI